MMPFLKQKCLPLRNWMPHASQWRENLIIFAHNFLPDVKMMTKWIKIDQLFCTIFNKNDNNWIPLSIMVVTTHALFCTTRSWHELASGTENTGHQRHKAPPGSFCEYTHLSQLNWRGPHSRILPITTCTEGREWGPRVGGQFSRPSYAWIDSSDAWY